MNSPVRGVLRWCAASPWMRRRLPRFAFLARAARRFVPGETADDALGVTVDLQVLGIGTIYTYLGGDVREPADAARAADAYGGLLTALRTGETEGEIAVRLTQLGLADDEDACFTRLVALAAAAEAQGSYLWLEMDEAGRVDQVLDMYQRLRATHPQTGVCLQASLRRTAKDVERLLPISPAIRLVKGEHDAPKGLAFTSRREIDANFSAIAVTLLREGRARPLRIALATHDVELLMQIVSHAAAAGIAKTAFEIQMLYGVRPREQRRLVRAGYTVQTLIPFGPDWYPWYMRRLAERPANVLAALRQLVG